MLDEFRRLGVPVLSSTHEWSLPARDRAVQRGSHQLAQQHVEFTKEEMVDMIQKHYWIVLPYHLVRRLPNLRISPLGVVPQRERRPRIIVDYTFSGVNDDTVKQAPREAMQFGHALERILRHILFAPAQHGPVYLLKIDLLDGFYRVQLRPEDLPRLGVILPSPPDNNHTLHFPLFFPWDGVKVRQTSAR